MEIISALCEVHPQLRVANLYVRTLKTEKVFSLASVVDNTVCLEESECERRRLILTFPVSTKLLDNYKFKTTSIDGEYIHLRMPIGVPQGVTSGSESTEVLDLDVLSSSEVKTKTRLYIPSLERTYRIHCAECQSIFVNSVRFERVLPLPCTSWTEAASDWYCHQHSGEVKHQKLVPRLNDCLFGSSYYALSANLLTEENLFSNGKESACTSCQSSVGLIGEGRWNVWCHAIKWTVLENNIWIHKNDATSPLQSFYFTLYNAMEEDKSFFGRKMVFRDCLDNSKFIILWFIGDNGFTLESSMESSSETLIKMRPSSLHKILYRRGNSAGEKIPGDVSEYQISGQMMSSVLEVLRNSSEHLPPDCRTAAGFSIGYLSLPS